MKKALVLFIVAAFLVSMAGCVAKTDYDKLVKEKKAQDKKCEELLTKEKDLTSEIETKKAEIEGLKYQLEESAKNVADLEKSLAESKAKAESVKITQ